MGTDELQAQANVINARNMVEDRAYDRAIAYARERGEQDGRNAAEWYLQDALRSTRDGVAIRRILAGIESGDLAILDTFPTADLSGQWADTLTGPALVKDALESADLLDDEGTDDEAGYMLAFSDICDAYETAFSDAVQDEIARAARAVLEP